MDMKVDVPLGPRPEPSRSWRERLDHALWRHDIEGLPPLKRKGLRFARVLYVLVRDLASGELTLRAMSLVYTTLLSLVPLLAFSFSLLKAFGVHNQLQPMLATFFAPLGERGEDMMRRIVAFIENVNVGVLGAAGLALLIYTVVSLMHKVEESFNFIWHVSRSRGVGERFSRYLSVLLVGPLLVFSAMGATASLMNAPWIRDVLAWDVIEHAAGFVTGAIPYLLVIAAFTFVYAFIPNTRVKVACALVGGIVGGILWQTAGWGFATFVASSTRYAAIYSGFAIVILFMIWLYVSWLIVLFGASVAFYSQYPQYLLPLGGEPRLSNRMRERLALAVAVEVARAHSLGEPLPRLQDLVERLSVPHHGVERVVDTLIEQDLLAEAADGRYLPARDFSMVSVHELLETIRSTDEGRYLSARYLPLPKGAEELLQRHESASERVLGAVSIAQLATGFTPSSATD